MQLTNSRLINKEINRRKYNKNLYPISSASLEFPIFYVTWSVDTTYTKQLIFSYPRPVIRAYQRNR
jgi:hypothetical protein